MRETLFARISRSATALAAGQGIQILIQFLIPPAFLAVYGVRGYAEWLVISASVGYLTFLDFGFQTYVVNELTVLFHRGELDKFRRLQSTALKLVLGVLLVSALLALCLFFIPIGAALKLSISEFEVSLTLYVLALQMLLAILFGQLSGMFRAVGNAHRSIVWANVYKLFYLAVTILLISMHVPYWVIGLGQVMALVVSLLALLIDLKRKAPVAMPRLEGWDAALAKACLKPSGFFALFALNNFLVYQAPILLFNHFLSSQVVIIFSIARVLFSFARQCIVQLSHAIAPEITRLYGIGDLHRLARLYQMGQALVMSLAVTFSAGVYFLSSVLIWLWLRRTDLFDSHIFLGLMVISIIMVVKDFRLNFQFATNKHEATAAIMLASYLIMILLGVPLVFWFGVDGFLSAWALAEIFQAGVIYTFNKRLLSKVRIEGGSCVWRAVPVVGLIIVAAVFSEDRYLQLGYFLQCIAATLIMLTLGITSYFSLGLKGPILELRRQFRAN